MPEAPSIDEQNAFGEKLGLFGSTKVGDAYDEFVKSLNGVPRMEGTLSATSEMIPGSTRTGTSSRSCAATLADLAKVEQLARDELRTL